MRDEGGVGRLLGRAAAGVTPAPESVRRHRLHSLPCSAAPFACGERSTPFGSRRESRQSAVAAAVGLAQWIGETLSTRRTPCDQWDECSSGYTLTVPSGR